MPHYSPLITTIVAGIGLAFLFGTLANRFRISPLVGYLMAGIVAGPFTPGFVADQSLALELAEIGVILLMFGVGLHFSLKDLLSVGAIAVPGAVVQIGAATAMGCGLAWMLDWSLATGVVFGLALSVASTVVLLRALQERRLVDTERGRIAVGWLIVEDLAMVLTLVLLPALAGLLVPDGKGADAHHEADWLVKLLGLGDGLEIALAVTFAKVGAFVAFMLVVGRRAIPWLLHWVAHTGSRELFRLAVLATALCVAFGAAQLFGVSLALGAFFAGMVLSESALSHQAAQETLPLRDAFAVLFFVSAGMLFDPTILWRDPVPVLATLFIILLGKSIAAFLIVLAFRHPARTALTISASLAQIGEFSFILAELGVKLNMLPEAARDLILAGAILSIMINPLMFALLDRLEKRMGKGERPADAAAATAKTDAKAKPTPDSDLRPTMLHNHVVLVGYGRVGRLIGATLRERKIPLVVIEDADVPVSGLQGPGQGAEFDVILGNAADPAVLKAANLAHARHLVLAIPNTFEAGQVVTQARSSNPGLHIVARAHADAQVDHLTGLGANEVIMGEREIARGITEILLGTRDGEPPGACCTQAG